MFIFLLVPVFLPPLTWRSATRKAWVYLWQRANRTPAVPSIWPDGRHGSHSQSSEYTPNITKTVYWRPSRREAWWTDSAKPQSSTAESHLFRCSSPMVKRQTPHKKTIAQLSVSSSRTKGRQTSLKIPLRLLSSFDGKQEDLDEPLQTVLVHGLHLDITWKSLDCLSCQQKPLKQRGLLASPVIRRSSGRYLYIS